MLRFIYVIITNLFRAPYIITKMRYMADHPERFSEAKRYQLSKVVIGYMKRSGNVTTKVFGTKNLPKNSGYILTPNHQGKYDALGIVMSHEKPCSLVMDMNKSNTILVSEFLDLLQGKRMSVHDVRQAMKVIQLISKELKDGRNFIIFPEGGYKFNNKNRLGEFKAGSFKAAYKAKAPIVPVVLFDSYKVFNSFYLGKVVTQVHYLEPLYYEDYKELKTVEVAAMVKKKIEDKIEEIKFNAIIQTQGSENSKEVLEI